jgi:hypothetical protein
VFAFALVAILPGQAVVASPETATVCKALHNKIDSQMEHVFVRDEFHVFYALTGSQALPDRTDRNANDVPDSVEDVAAQLVAARKLFSDVMQLRHPLQQARYAHASAIYVFLADIGKGRGSAFDEVSSYADVPDGKNRCVLRINLHRDNLVQGVSPTHELFHLYQYGYSMFKVRWFTEGTARWAEYAIRSGQAPEQLLPADEVALDQRLLGRTYAAGGIWNRLAVLLDPVGRLRLPVDLQAMTYLDGTPIVGDDVLHGVSFMRALLEELGKESLQVSRQEGWQSYSWHEADQQSAAYNAAILRAVLAAINAQANQSEARNEELESFVQTLRRRSEEVNPGLSPLPN